LQTKTQNTSYSSIIYSIGLGTDQAWDVRMLQRYGVAVYGYDPSSKAAASVQKNPILNDPVNSFPYHFTQEGLDPNEAKIISLKEEEIDHTILNSNNIATQQGNKEAGDNLEYYQVQFHTLLQWMERNHHDHIDVLKLNVKGHEISILEAWLKDSKIVARLDQLLVAFHGLKDNDNKRRYRAAKIIRLFEKNGFEVYYSSFDVNTDNGEVSMKRKAGC